MKKLFFYAAAAVAMLAGCQKNEIAGPQAIDDNQPAAIKFGIDAPSLTTVATRAAVKEWDNSTVYVYGLKQGHEDGAMYNIANPFINNYETVAASGTNTALEVYDTGAGTNVPYFYAEGQTYDFFGYHLGTATATLKAAENDQITYNVEIDGSQDVMVAYAHKDDDIRKKANQAMGIDDVYSAWAARRDVQPTLKFQHALSRFNIIVRGMNTLSEHVTITSVKVSAQKTGDLVVVHKDYELGYTGTGEDVNLVLMNDPAEFPVTPDSDENSTPEEQEDSEENTESEAPATDLPNGAFTNYRVVKGNTAPAGGTNACFMLAPNKGEFTFTVESMNHVYGTTLPTQPVTVKATELVKSGHGLLDADERENAGATVFEAGKAYNIYINVYGPEEIKITAELTEWVDGGDFVYDPDRRPGSGTADITPNPSDPSDEPTDEPQTPATPNYVAVPEAELNNTVQADEDQFNALVATLGQKCTWTYAEVQSTLPWVSAIFPALTEAKQVKVTVNGVKALDIITANWPADTVVDGTVVTFTYGPSRFDSSYIGFEKKELILDEGQSIENVTLKVEIAE